MEVSVILPCLNEEESIGKSIEIIQKALQKNKIKGEIIIVDNGSTDNSKSIIQKSQNSNVKYIFEPKKGYGNAYLAGLKKAEGEYIIMGDPDSSYDFNEIPRFLKELEKNDFVLGSRFQGKIEKGAMSLKSKIGNSIIRNFMRILYNLKITEPSTGFVGIKKSVLKKINLKQKGMEFSSELIIKAHQNRIEIKEIPINYSKRSGQSKIRPLRDGLRHVNFLIKNKIR